MKVAICISGQMRTYQQCYNKMKKNIIDPLNGDIFLVTQKDIGKSHKEEAIENKGYIDENEINRIYSPKDYEIEDFGSNITEYLNGVKIPDSLKKAEPKNYKGSLPMFYMIYKCNQLKKKYEKKNSFYYDIVIRIRPDLMVKNKIPREVINNILAGDETLYFSDYAIDLRSQVSDKFALANSEVMDKYCSVWKFLNCYWKKPLGDGETKNYRVGERLMYHHINEEMKLKNKSFKIKCFIKRNGKTNNPYSIYNKIKKKVKIKNA